MTSPTLPTYPGTDRVITPGDRFRLIGNGVDPAYEGFVDSITLDQHGWTIWDTDGNDRRPEDHWLIGWKVSAAPAVEITTTTEVLSAELVGPEGSLGTTDTQAAITAAATYLGGLVAVTASAPNVAAELIVELAEAILARWPGGSLQ